MKNIPILIHISILNYILFYIVNFNILISLKGYIFILLLFFFVYILIFDYYDYYFKTSIFLLYIYRTKNKTFFLCNIIK